MKTKAFSVGGNDLKWDTFRCGGKGGQNVNKRDTGARVTHVPSGISHEGREERSQEQNKRSALRKLAADPKFQLWCRMQYAAKKEGYDSMARKVDQAMADHNLRIEITEVCGPNEAHCDVRGAK